MRQNLNKTDFVQYNFNNSRRVFVKEVSNEVGLKSESYPIAPKTVGEFECLDEYYTKRHGLAECLLLFTIDGKGRIVYGDCEKQVAKGDLFAINCNNFQEYNTLKKHEWHFLWIHFIGHSAMPFVDAINEDGLAVINGQYEGQIRRIFDMVCNCDVFSHHKAGGILYELLLEIVEKTRRYGGDSANKKNNVNKQVLASLEESAGYIDTHYYTDVNIASLAAKAMLSKYYFIKMFSEVYDTTPYDYLLRVRINKAKELLISSDKSVEEIAHQVGFSDSKNLIVMFSKRENTTPFQYRKNLLFR